MATTEKGIYYPNDYEVIADIPTDMKKMAESAEKAIEDSKYDDKDIKQQVSDLQQENASKTEQIEQLKSENEELKQLNQMQENWIPKGEVEGEYLSIKDSTRYPFKKLEISGNSWQEKREGYNIFNINNNYLAGQTVNLAGVDITFNTDGSITLNGTAKENDLYIVNQDYQIKPTKDFYLVFEHLGGTISTTNYTTFTCTEVTDSGNIYTNNVPLGNSGTNTSKITYNNADHYDGWRLYVQKNCVFTNYKIRVWVSYKDTTEFEQYGAMPSLDYPSQIRNCGDNGNVNFNVCNENFLEIDKGKEKTFNGLTVSFLENGNIKINGTAEWTSYVNLLNMSDGNTNNFAKRFFPLGDYYNYFNYISGKILNSNFSVNLRTGALDDNSSTTLANGRNSSNYTLSDFKKGTIKDNLLVSYIWINKGASFENYEFNVQLKKEDLKPDFILHESQSFTFPCKQGQVIHEGDFLADDGVHHKRKTTVYDGSDDEKFDVTKTSSSWEFRILNSDIKVGQNGNEIPKVLCDKLPTVSVNTMWNKSDSGISIAYTSARILFSLADKSIVTVNDFRNFLSTNPLTVECELAEEIIEPYSEEQQLVYNEIKKAISYKGGTNVFCTDPLSCKFKATYFKDLETLIAGGGN